FLLPRGLALAATPAIIRETELRVQKEVIAESADRERLLELAEQIEGKELHFKARAGAGDRLFGSVTSADIAEELSQAVGFTVDKKKIDIEKPIRQAGSHEVAVRLAGDIKPKIAVVIEEEQD
ncbi:MAG: 50S ribosomal protein L9, partial [Dehalococcoidia bacterium]